MNYKRKNNEIRRLEGTLEKIGKLSRDEMRKAAYDAAKGFRTADEIDDCMFYDLIGTLRGDSDIIVEYVYKPTYLACGIMMYAVLEDSNMLNDSTFSGVLSYGLKGSTRRGFMGSGYDDIKGFIEAMDIMAHGRALEFIKRYPDFCPVFTEKLSEAVTFLREKLVSGRVTDMWSGESYRDRALPVYKRLINEEDGILLFVYGTLMNRQEAHRLLKDSEYLGRFMLSDYAMYDLGNFPGIVENMDENTAGEVYCIDKKTLEEIDEYEGSVYVRKTVKVSNESDILDVYAYVYTGDVSSLKPMRTMWGIRDDDEVWYACYGSNMSSGRFKSYIKGGLCRYNGKTYEGCRDKSLWKDDSVDFAAGRVYFGNRSSSWSGKGVSLYDPEAKGCVIMRNYRIKYSQLCDIRQMEGPSENWYGRIVLLGIDDDIPVYTLTSEKRRPSSAPSRKYIDVIVDAMRDEMEISETHILNSMLNSLTEE